MKYFVNGKKMRLNLFTNCIGEGCQFKTYRIDDKVLKIIKKNPAKNIILSEDLVERMKRISTKRILLPINLVLDKRNNIRGYQMNYIDNIGEDSYFNLKKDRFREENELLRNDIRELSNNKILISDLIIENTVYNRGLYLIDPGDYVFNDNISSNEIYKVNISYLNHYLIYEILLYYHLNKYNSSNNYLISYMFSNNINFEYSNSNKSDFLEYLSDMDEDNLSDFVETRVNGKNPKKLIMSGQKCNFVV